MSLQGTVNVTMTASAVAFASRVCNQAVIEARLGNTGTVTIYETGTATVVAELRAGESLATQVLGHNMNSYDAKSSFAGDAIIIRTE